MDNLKNDLWKNKFSLLKYNRENNYNRIIIDKLFYNPIFLGNLHLLNPYKYDKKRKINYKYFDYNIYQNPEEQLDYTNRINIGSIDTKIKGSTIYVLNELNLSSNLIYTYKADWILNWLNSDDPHEDLNQVNEKKLLDDGYFSFFKDYPLEAQFVADLSFKLENNSSSKLGLNCELNNFNFYEGNPYLK